MSRSAVGHVIASRVFQLAGGGEVTLSFGAPIQLGGDFACMFVVEGLGSGAVQRAFGKDELECFLYAIQKASQLLFASEEYRSGRLTWNGQRSLGFPVGPKES